MVAGETKLNKLLQGMAPRLQEGEYVFCTLKDWPAIDPSKLVGSFKEAEGWTLILARETADAGGLPYEGISSWITLTVHSSLEAVGLTAAFSKALADRQIPCNVVAGFYHDHIFVPVKDAALALKVLEEVAGIRVP